MALSSGTFVPALTSQSINLLSADGTQMRSLTFDNTQTLVSSITSQNAYYIPILQGSYPITTNSNVRTSSTSYNLVLGFDSNLGSSTTIAPSTGSDGTVSSVSIFNNHLSLTYVTDVASPTQTLVITSYSLNNLLNSTQTYVSSVYAVVVSCPYYDLNQVSTVTATFNTPITSTPVCLTPGPTTNPTMVWPTVYTYAFTPTVMNSLYFTFQVSTPGGTLTLTSTNALTTVSGTSCAIQGPISCGEHDAYIGSANVMTCIFSSPQNSSLSCVNSTVTNLSTSNLINYTFTWTPTTTESFTFHNVVGQAGGLLVSSPLTPVQHTTVSVTNTSTIFYTAFPGIVNVTFSNNVNANNLTLKSSRSDLSNLTFVSGNSYTLVWTPTITTPFTFEFSNVPGVVSSTNLATTNTMTALPQQGVTITGTPINGSPSTMTATFVDATTLPVIGYNSDIKRIAWKPDRINRHSVHIRVDSYIFGVNSLLFHIGEWSVDSYCNDMSRDCARSNTNWNGIYRIECGDERFIQCGNNNAKCPVHIRNSERCNRRNARHITWHVLYIHMVSIGRHKHIIHIHGCRKYRRNGDIHGV